MNDFVAAAAIEHMSSYRSITFIVEHLQQLQALIHSFVKWTGLVSGDDYIERIRWLFVCVCGINTIADDALFSLVLKC